MTDDFCNKCGACCKRIKADFKSGILYWDEKMPLNKEFADMLTPIPNEENFYICKYLKDNLCTNPNKPSVCINYPASPFAVLPETCTYSGKIFMQKEKIMQKIRKLKEEIIHYEALCSNINNKEQNQLKKIIQSHIKYIEKYNEFGSKDW